MCKECSCDNIEKCSIVGFMPIGFCCEKCMLFVDECLCENVKEVTKSEISDKKIKLILANIEGENLKVVIEQGGKRIPLHFNLSKFLSTP